MTTGSDTGDGERARRGARARLAWGAGLTLGIAAIVALVIALRPPAPIPIGGVELSDARAVVPASLSVDEAESIVRAALDERLSSLERLDEAQRVAALDQVSPLIVAYTHNVFDRYFGLVSTWGGRPREGMTAANLDALRRYWSSLTWERVDLDHAKLWLSQRSEDGVLSLVTPRSGRGAPPRQRASPPSPPLCSSRTRTS